MTKNKKLKTRYDNNNIINTMADPIQNMCYHCGIMFDTNVSNNKRQKDKKKQRSLYKENNSILAQIEYDMECIADATRIVQDMYINFDDGIKDYPQNELINISNITSKDDIIHLFIKLDDKYMHTRRSLKESQKSQKQKDKELEEYELNFTCSMASNKKS